MWQEASTYMYSFFIVSEPSEGRLRWHCMDFATIEHDLSGTNIMDSLYQGNYLSNRHHLEQDRKSEAAIGLR